ncbi:MAG: hypothetical protein Q9162_001280 [Coniocarpon cinnabarinum]
MIGFPVSGLDWEEYMRLRPQYPTSLYTRIYDYHRAHSNNWTTVHDAGSGAGIAAEALAERFKHVIVSDPNSEYIKTAQERLKALKYGHEKFTFRQSLAEDQSWLSPRSLDMFTIFTAIGYADLALLMEQLSRVLKPGGTLVAVNYNGLPTITNNSAAAAAWEEFGDAWVSHGISTGNTAARRGLRVTWAGYDSIGVPEDTFETGVLRIKINERYRPEARQVLRLDNLGWPSSQVKSSDVSVDEEDIESWSRHYSLDDLKNYVNTLAYVPHVAAGRLWDRLGEAMEEQQQQTVTLLWSVHLILATRRAE